MNNRTLKEPEPDVVPSEGARLDLPPRFTLSRLPPPLRPAPQSDLARQIELEIQNQELRESQATLQRTRARYFELFDSAPVAYFVFDGRHNVEDLNLAAGELLGGERTRFKQRPFFTHLLEEDRIRFHHHVATVLARRERAETELRLLPSEGGSPRRVRLVSQSVPAEMGDRPVCLTAALPAAQGSEQTVPPRAGASEMAAWRDHLSAAGAAVAVTSAQGGWVFASPGLRALLGCSEPQLQEETWASLTHPDDREAEAAQFARLLSGEVDHYRIEKRVRHRSGGSRRVTALVTCGRGIDGGVDLLLHTLTEPLGESLPAVPPGESPGVELNRIVEAAVDSVPGIPSGDRLRLAFNPMLPPIPAAQTEGLQRGIEALLANAVESLEGGCGKLVVATGLLQVESDLLEPIPGGRPLTPGEYLYVEITDEGHGMTGPVQSRAFEPGFTTRPGHRGMGLSEAFGCATRLQGGLRLRSAPGRGTSVTLLLAPGTKPVPTGGRTEGERVMLVDDDPAVRQVTTRMIQSLGYEVEDFADGASALARLLASSPGSYSTLISDVAMPGMSGPALMEKVERAGRGVRCVLMTGLGEAHSGLGVGGECDAPMLQKPFTMARLREVLEPARRAAAR